MRKNIPKSRVLTALQPALNANWNKWNKALLSQASEASEALISPLN
jgi:hypothetical protein